MKILMINTVSGYGSTGSICEDIATVLLEQGHDCYISYGQLTTSYEKSFKIGTKLENHLHNLGSRIFGKQGYFTRGGTKKLVAFIKKYNPDVIHLHNLHGNYLNLNVLFDYLNEIQKPVVWTLHDCWAFTGKCTHYTDVACYKWQSQCSNCPQVEKYPPSFFFDKSSTMFTDKKKWFTGLKNLTIIPVSNWLAGEVTKSFFNKYPITPIYNWIDHDTFKYVENNDFLSKYNLDIHKFNILLVSASWYPSDGKWQDALKLAALLPDEMQIIMIGKVASPNLLPNSIKYIPYLHGKKELAKAYSIADVYVHLSTEDTFGKVIAEALSTGTPAVVYDATACPEIIGEGCGYIVEKRNIEQITNAIFKIKKNTKAFYAEKCKKHAVKNFDYYSNIDCTINVYKRIK